MKQIIQLYLFIALILFAVFSVLFYLTGAGYVYILWSGIQFQSNLTIVIFFSVLLSFLTHLSWYGFKSYINSEKRKLKYIHDFSQLHPYEQLGVIWILQDNDANQDFVQRIFQHSGLLQQIFQSKYESLQQNYETALLCLEGCPTATFELSEIQRIEIYLAQKKPDLALSHLQFLSSQLLSPWLLPVEECFNKRLDILWASFAFNYPWLYLAQSIDIDLNTDAMEKWLIQLLEHYDQASEENILELANNYIENEKNIKKLDYALQVLWLKLLLRIQNMDQYVAVLATHLLEVKFDQDVFYIWFQQQLLQKDPQYEEVELYIDKLGEKYPSLPVLSFAQWYIYTETQRFNEADELLTHFPNNIFMSYLRIKSSLKGQDDLLDELKLVFENDAKFVQFKI
ncbi:heme biosynthesis protein HemY [Acinetobacter rudis]|uniref:Heme biosynthesis protein HemY n=1 Tax=Acinetobacter rudis TaxID=632955 RepID=A0AAW8JBJ0_9GAMM|nr:heme biosynthesis protein HemY [Acinetobacter rudis]MDQ8935950.1 heme biosynthesis protein HemY [Acinetobacter rudis]MDQ8953605.1 heme biosynthesis protein HemY [Acinetobacter rudis]MDQ9018213.1 heme biosynthesis protein HemY [Acinetobacter rudis]